VGGQNYKHFKYDHVNSRSTRQVGSTFKPFVYTLAVDNGFSPCIKIPNQPVTFENYENWTPSNSEGIKGKDFTMFRGLALSVNYGVAYLLKQLGPNGPQSVIDLARKMGITNKLEAYPSICLGVFDLSVYEMVGAFGTFANKGIFVQPSYLVKITDKNGNVLKEFEPQTKEAMSEQTAYVMLKLLEGVTSHGTGYEVKGKYQIKGACGGKTGTTQNNSDGWFMGVTPNLVAGCWVGCEDRAIHFRTTDLGAGGHMALPIWARFFKKVQADSSLNVGFPDYFEPPKKKLTLEIECGNYAEPTDNEPVNFDGDDNQ
jgi:penicillin-binding protein 1A